MNEPRNTVIDTRDERARAEVRRYGFPSALISSTMIGTAQTILTASEIEVLEISALTFANENGGGGSGASVAVSVCIVDAGEIAVDANKAFHAVDVLASEVLRLDGALMLNPSQSLCVFADTTNKIRVSGWVTAHL